ncbi:MAG: DNA polymerase III subunit delta [Deltaproteobacteria bacterium]|nr:DNA polymerase III subunit delta [Deltaproteobacteria bacterium]
MSSSVKGEAARRLKPVYYIYGEEDYLMEEALVKIRKMALSKGFEQLNHHVYEAKTLRIAEVIETAMTVPAFSCKRLIVIKGAESLKEAGRDEFLDYAKAPSDSTCMVFVAAGGKIDRDSALIRHLKDQGCVKEYKRLTEDEAGRMVKERAAAEGKEISPAAVSKLVGMAGESLRDVLGELLKVITFVGGKKTVDEEDVMECASEVNDSTAFDLADAIARKDLARALGVLKRLEGDEGPKILGAIGWQLRTLVKVKSHLKKGAEPYSLAGMLRISWKNINRYVAGSRNFSEDELLSALKRLAAADVELKSWSLPEGLVLSRLVMDLCGKGRASGQRPASL